MTSFIDKHLDPIGSRLSPIIADIVLQDLESTVFNKLTINLPFYVRYVDGIAFAIDRISINDILSKLLIIIIQD